MNTFQDFKLDADLITFLANHGYTRPTALQREAVPVIARGTTVVGMASSGSGKTLAYGLGLASRLDPASTGLQALILRPTDDRASATADALLGPMKARGLSVALAQSGSAAKASHIVVASPSSAMAALEHSAIKLDTLKALIVDGASLMADLGAAESLETLAAQTPKEAQRVFLTSQLTQEIEDWFERHARRARKLAWIPTEVKRLDNVAVEFWTAPQELWLPVLTRVLESMTSKSESGITVRCRFRHQAATLANRLVVRGFDASSDDARIRVTAEGATEITEGESSVSWGSPPDPDGLRTLAEKARRCVVFVEPREMAHLQQLAASLEVRLTTLKTTPEGDALRSVQLTREQLSEAAAGRDLEPYMLLLEPLFDEFTPVQLAAAATALFREHLPAHPDQPLPAWTRLYFGVGRRDGIRPSDLVGAITGEAPIGGDRIGRIEIRDTHTSVEVAASVADKVIKSLATATIRGRPANVRVFRE
jgi:ATP-dependent RNA helicase DeaD